MNNVKRIKIGNIFKFAEKRLMDKIKRGDIYSYSLLDVIDNAIKVRKYLDINPCPKIPSLTPEEKRLNQLKRMRRYYIKKMR